VVVDQRELLALREFIEFRMNRRVFFAGRDDANVEFGGKLPRPIVP
jgi:hypothetical protein